MVPGLLYRRIAFDLVRLTLLSLAGLSSVLMLAGAMLEASKKGIDPMRIISAMPYLIPPTLPFTLPTCVLLACVVVYGGMASANEIIAVKSAGINIMRLLRPAFVLAVLTAGVSITLADRVIPMCNRRFAEWVLSDIEGMLLSYLSTNGWIVEEGFPYEIYVQSVRDGKLINTIIVHRLAGGGHDFVAQASEAVLKVYRDADGKDAVSMRMTDGIVTSKDGAIHFVDRTFDMPTPKSVRTFDEKSETLTFEQCQARAEERKAAVNRRLFDFATSTVVGAVTGDLESFSQIYPGFKMENQRLNYKIAQVEAEVPFRISLALSTVPFVLLGCPISLLLRRRDFLQSFFLCFLPIILAYYPMLMLGFNMFQETHGEQFLWLFGPSLLLTVAAIPLLRRAIRY